MFATKFAFYDVVWSLKYTLFVNYFQTDTHFWKFYVQILDIPIAHIIFVLLTKLVFDTLTPDLTI